MAELTRDQVETALKGWVEPHLGQDLVSAGAIKEIAIDGGRVALTVELGFPAAGYRDELARQLQDVVRAATSATDVKADIGWNIASHAVRAGLKQLQAVKNIIAIASGKGGVGKSTTAVNLALALAAEGASAGVLDADIYGPSQPRMLGLSGRPESRDGKLLEPMEHYGVQAMSIGFLIDEEQPMIWRGPMVTQALTQLLNETNWRSLDYLIIDLPPGTGDIQLTLAQKVPVTGAVIVTTPQDIALLDARRGLQMFRKVDVNVLGLIENMSMHVCSNCGHEEHIFGAGGGERMAAQYGARLLGSLPLDISIREQTDAGAPTVAAEPEGRIAVTYRAIARAAAAELAKGGGGAFPEIVVEET